MTINKKLTKKGKTVKVTLGDDLREAIARAIMKKGQGTFAGYLREAAIIRLAKEGYL